MIPLPGPGDLTPLPMTGEAEIPPSYLDEMGHMNVMWYTHLFSEATGGFFERFGMGMAYMESGQAGAFALEAHIRYVAEVRAGDVVVLRTRALGRSAKRLHFLHFMTRGGQLAATCEFVGAHIDMGSRRMAPLPDAIAAAFDAILADHARLPWPAPVCGVMGP